MFIWLMAVLKIPIAALLWLVWWASKAPEAQDEEPARIDRRPVPGPDHPRRPRWPRPPRRGPHAEPMPRAPSRVRLEGVALSRARPLR
jgi:hypothetical protein